MPAMDALSAKVLLSEELPTGWYQRYMKYFLRSFNSAKQNPIWADTQAEQSVTDMVRWLKAGEAYYVHPRMTEVITAAAETMPEEPLLPEDMPSSHGFVLIPGGLTTIDLRGSLVVSNAVLWATFGGRVYLTLFTDKYDARDDATVHDDPKWKVLPRYTPNHFGQLVFGKELPTTAGPDMLIPPEYGVHVEYINTPDGGMSMAFASDKGYTGEQLQELFHFGQRPDPVLKWLVAMWRLMQQPLTALVKEEPTRQMRRQLERKNVPDKHVTVVTLRRKGGDRNSETEVNWSHRWLVKGHWRKQWYGSGENRVQRVIWIHPFVKGPEDAPLLVREHVYSLER